MKPENSLKVGILTWQPDARYVGRQNRAMAGRVAATGRFSNDCTHPAVNYPGDQNWGEKGRVVPAGTIPTTIPLG
ncbi:MAG TPA: hypothetical protein DDW52_22400 [Planctomycetaceae bacterium]|nr:hypothetical protein [Planctomycetaceae bacterium]